MFFSFPKNYLASLTFVDDVDMYLDESQGITDRRPIQLQNKILCFSILNKDVWG